MKFEQKPLNRVGTWSGKVRKKKEMTKVRKSQAKMGGFEKSQEI